MHSNVQQLSDLLFKASRENNRAEVIVGYNESSNKIRQHERFFKCNNTFSYANLFEYIPKNTALQKEVDKIDINNVKVIELLNAIKVGNFDATLFSKKNCDLYLLKLFKLNKITSAEFFTLYTHLMSLMEFTDKPALKKVDRFLKRKHAVTVETNLIFQNAEITEIGKIYLEDIYSSFKNDLGIELDRVELEKHIKSLPAVEQSFTFIKIQDSLYQRSTASVFDEVVENTPTFLHKINYDDINEVCIFQYYFPSFSIQYFLKSKLGYEQMNLKPGFGKVGDQTLHRLHQKNQHFYPLYNRFVKKNMTRAHNENLGPFSIAKHDDGHAFWASFLEKKYRDEIVNTLIPDLLSLRQEIADKKNEIGKESSGKLLAQIDMFAYGKLNELQVVYVLYFNLDPSQTFNKFLIDCFYHVKMINFYQLRLENINISIIYYLIAKLCLSKSTDNIGVWKHVLDLIQREASDNPHSLITQKTLKKLAELTINPDSFSLDLSQKISVGVDWKLWRNKLRETSDSKELWDWAVKIDNKGLLSLINDCNLSFFHPFLPLTAEKHEMLLKFVETQYKKNGLAQHGLFSLKNDGDDGEKLTTNQIVGCKNPSPEFSGQ